MTFLEKKLCYGFSLNVRKVLIMDFSFVWTDYYFSCLNICCWIYFIFCFNILFANSVRVSSLENPVNFVRKYNLFIVFCCDSKVEIFCNADYRYLDDQISFSFAFFPLFAQLTFFHTWILACCFIFAYWCKIFYCLCD